MPDKRKFSDNASTESQQRYVRNKTKAANEYIVMLLLHKILAATNLRKEVVRKVVFDNGFLTLAKGRTLFDIRETVTLRDLSQISPNAVYKLKSGHGNLQPNLPGFILPTKSK